MPRLMHPKAVPVYAMEALTRVCMRDTDFANELHELRRNHQDVVRWMGEWRGEALREIGASPQPVYQLLADYRAGGTGEVKISPGQDLSRLGELTDYLRDLAGLADRWKLRSIRALAVLLATDIEDPVWAMSTDKPSLPMNLAEKLYPWPPPLPQLEIRISSWDVVDKGRKQVLAEIAEKLEDYEGQIKRTGVIEYLSALDKHARWWFKHYVKGMKYREICEEEMDGSVSATEETIKRAVSRFSRLAGIRVI